MVKKYLPVSFVVSRGSKSLRYVIIQNIGVAFVGDEAYDTLGCSCL